MESYFGAARRPEAMRLLLDAGLPADGHPRADRSPWMGAVEVKALGIAPLLVDHDTGLDVGRPQGTPLTSAATSLQLESPRWLLDRGVDPNIEDATGRTRLEAARQTYVECNKKACVALLEGAISEDR